MSAELERLAAACILPGFEGTSPPDWVLRRIADGLGGIVLFAWNVESREQVEGLVAALRSESDRLLVAIDEEGGDVTRLEAMNGSSYPGNAALGAVDDLALTERVATAMAAELVAAGINLNLAPVADVNTNPDNPVIGVRSFGADPDLVARHVAAYVRGLQAAGVAACAKHFPGHGDTGVDSHLELPVLETVSQHALLPFRAAVDAGVRAIMTAHIVVRSVGDSPATTSRELLHGLLRTELGFDGLVVTDALEMRAISATIGVEEGAVRAIAAGADALCLGHDLFDDSVRSVSDALVAAVRSGGLPESRLAEAAARVGAAGDLSRGRPPSEQANSGVGREAARRALEVHVDRVLTLPPLVVELAAEPGMAAGRLSQGPGDWFRSVVPGTEAVKIERGDPVNLRSGSDRPLVVFLRDAHRHAWQRELVAAIVAASPDVVLVETGLPGWRPPGVSYVLTHGAGRVNVEAAAERLYSRPRRGVEQSGSSPGS